MIAQTFSHGIVRGRQDNDPDVKPLAALASKNI
jgi:hypothetical protein